MHIRLIAIEYVGDKHPLDQLDFLLFSCVSSLWTGCKGWQTALCVFSHVKCHQSLGFLFFWYFCLSRFHFCTTFRNWNPNLSPWMCDVQKWRIPLFPAPCKMKIIWAEAQRIDLDVQFLAHYVWMKGEEHDSIDLNPTGCVLCHCRSFSRICHNGVALDCCLSESLGHARGIWSRSASQSPAVASSNRPSAFQLKVSEKRQVAYLVCLCNPFPLWCFLSLPLSTAHQWLSLCSHPAQRVSSSKCCQKRLHKLALVIDAAKGAPSRGNYPWWESNPRAMGQCTVHSVISLVLYCTYR